MPVHCRPDALPVTNRTVSQHKSLVCGSLGKNRFCTLKTTYSYFVNSSTNFHHLYKQVKKEKEMVKCARRIHWASLCNI